VSVVQTAAGAPAGALVDPGGQVARHYGIGDSGMALIRPDGYLGHLSTRADADSLAAHLTGPLHAERQSA
jgi:hypothetical protein